MTPAEYCKDVCGARCCTLWEEQHTCMFLKKDCTCSIYKERFAEGQPDYVKLYDFTSPQTNQLRPFVCGRVKILLATNNFPEWLAKECCYAHPELLEEKKGNGETNNQE